MPATRGGIWTDRPGRSSGCARCCALVVLLASGFVLRAACAAPATLQAPDIAAHAFFLLEPQSGSELAMRNADEQLPPASLTKLMTAYLLFGELRDGRLKPDEPVVVGARAARQPGARMFLNAGESVPAEALINGMLVDSGNDATLALVEHVSPDTHAFVARMNAKAVELGLSHTRFANVTGLQSPGHYSSARDLAYLATALRRDFPEYLGWFARREFTWSGVAQRNRNLLLGHMPGVDGMKTGHTHAAGFCLVASAERDGMKLVAVLLGMESEIGRARDGRKLLEFGFHNFETRLVYRAGAPIASLPLWQGEQDSVALGVRRDVFLTLPNGAFDRIRTQVVLPGEPLAPVMRGASLGQLDLADDRRQLAVMPLVALTDVPEGGFAKRMADRLRRLLQREGEARAAP
jgi:D-alanyl-D-alanine carboxypeptidase (penicillin-binding protein 5/6)